MQSAPFAQDGLMVIVFDEAGSDSTHGGGRAVCVLVGPKVRAGFRSDALYQHQSVLRLTARALGLMSAPGAGATAADMGEFFAP